MSWGFLFCFVTLFVLFFSFHQLCRWLGQPLQHSELSLECSPQTKMLTSQSVRWSAVFKKRFCFHQSVPRFNDHRNHKQLLHLLHIWEKSIFLFLQGYLQINMWNKSSRCGKCSPKAAHLTESQQETELYDLDFWRILSMIGSFPGVAMIKLTLCLQISCCKHRIINLFDCLAVSPNPPSYKPPTDDLQQRPAPSLLPHFQ